MMRRVCFINGLAMFVLSLLLLQCEAQVDSDREANRLFVEAYRLTDQAMQIEKDDPASAFIKYREALNNIDAIIESFPETQIAVDVTQQQTRIGEMSIGELRRKLPVLELRADALSNFTYLSDYLKSRITNDVTRAIRHLRQGEWFDKAGQHDLYLRRLNKIHESAERHWNTEISDSLYLILATHYVSAEKVESAIEMADMIRDSRLMSEALHHIVSSISGDMDNDDIYADILTLMDFVDPTDHIQLLSMLIEQLLLTGKSDLAYRIIQQDVRPPYQNRLSEYIQYLNTMQNAFARNNDREAATFLIDRIRELDDNYHMFALRDYAVSLSAGGNFDDALAKTDSLDSEYFRDTAFAGIAVRMAERGWVTDALALLENISDNTSESILAQLDIAYILSDFNDYARSDSLLTTVVPLVREIRSGIQRSGALIKIAHLHKLRNQPSQTAGFLDEAETSASSITDAKTYNKIALSIIDTWIDLGRPDRAIRLAETLRTTDSDYAILIQFLMESAVNKGRINLARSFVSISNDPHRYAWKLNQALLEKQLSNQATTLAYDIRNFPWRSKALADLAVYFRQTDQTEKAHKTASDALLLIQRIREISDKEEALEYVSSRFSAAGLPMDRELQALSSEIMSSIDY